MELTMSLCLPRDYVSVPTVRNVLSAALTVLKVDPDDIDDIGLAITEAATNVLKHAKAQDEWEVAVRIEGLTCVIEVADKGSTFHDGGKMGYTDAPEGAESGRGIQIMRALVDEVTFFQHEQDGTVTRMTKQLRVLAGGPLAALDGT